MKGKYVSITLHQIGAVLPYNLLTSLVDTIKNAAFVIDLRLRRVEVLGCVGVVFDNTASETNNLTRKTKDGKDYSTSEAIGFIVITNYCKSRFLKVLELIAMHQSLLCKCISLFGRVTQLKLPDYVIPNAALPEVTKSNRLSLVGFI